MVPEGVTPGRGGCTPRALLTGAVLGVGAAGCWGSVLVCHPCPCASQRVPWPPRAGTPLPWQGPAGWISAFLFLILLFSYTSTSLCMTVREAFIQGEAEYRFINSYRASGNIFNPSTTILNKYG